MNLAEKTQILTVILDKIKDYDTIIIHRHKKPDPDALGSQIGLKELLKAEFPLKNIYAVGYDEPSLNFLAHMDEVSDEDYKGALVIVCDTANQPRIDDERYKLGDFLIKIDHHPDDDVYGDISYVDTRASSASEIISEFALINDLSFNSASARLLYAGIIGDTGRFLYPSTTSKTMEIASVLRQEDFDFAKLGRQMDTHSMEIAKLQAYVIDNLIIDNFGAAYVEISQETLKEYGVSENEVSAVVGVPGQIDSVKSWIIFTEQPQGYYRANLRSKDLIINDIAKKYKGGGHPLASGAVSSSHEENMKIYQDLEEKISSR